MSPPMVGYLSARGSTPRRTMRASMDAMAAYAESQGCTMGQVFVEPDDRRPTSALTELIASVVRCGAAAVVVATPEDLGRDVRVQELMRLRIERDTCLPVLIIPRLSRAVPAVSADRPNVALLIDGRGHGTSAIGCGVLVDAGSSTEAPTQLPLPPLRLLT
jgi:hypothetical protein